MNSSDSDDEDFFDTLDFILKIKSICFKKRRLCDEISNIPVVNFDTAGDATLLYHFRFTRNEIVQLVSVFGIPEWLPLRYRVSGLHGLCILLKRLAFPNRLHEIAEWFGKNHSTSQISAVCTYLVGYLVKKYSYILYLDGDSLSPRLAGFAGAIHRAALSAVPTALPLQNVWGFVDGTCLYSCRPTKLQRLLYSGHKRRHCLKFQAVTTPDGMISSLFGPVEGRRTDAFMISESGILGAHLALGGAFLNHVLYSDGGYGDVPFLRRPVRGSPPAGTPSGDFNRAMSAVRTSVEWSFKIVHDSFKYTDYCKQMKVLRQPVALYYMTSVLLANCRTILSRGNQISTYFNVLPPSLEEYLIPNSSSFRVTPPVRSFW